MNKFSGGFTLIELLIVIIIVGLLSAFMLSAFPLAQAKNRDQKRKNDLKNIRIALEQYFADQGSYPCLPTSSCLSTDTPPRNLTYSNQITTDSSSIIYQLVTTYLKSIPQDPMRATTNCNGYFYAIYADASGRQQGYVLLANLEDTEDPDVVNPTSKPLPGFATTLSYVNGTVQNAPSAPNCNSSPNNTWNYWISSPD